ncbi:MAG: carboxypeptidase regulatory-like domain-containing protein [Variovorax sp.]|nr:MAG: carboxypeptidase regulatory-like domain-containing protein [Variovorax sp.]
MAATGAPFAKAAITVTDRTGATVCATETDDKGAYNCVLPAGTQAPLVIRAAREEQVFYSTTASAADGTANVTPLTTIIVSKLSPNGDPSALAGAIQTAPDTVTATTLDTQVRALVAALQPLLTALGTTIDPITGVFAADGTGADKVLDAISVSVRPDGTAANIEITVKTLPTAADSEPLSIVFRSDDATIEPLPATLTAQQLAPVPAPDVVAAFFSRVTACYALPLSTRVNAPNNDAPVIGGPDDVIAPVCRELFVGDNPATFTSNGNFVGRDGNNNGAFASLFRPGATGLQWGNGNVEFFRTDGAMVVSYRWVDALGNMDADTIALRDEGGVLKLTGNTNKYVASVRPISQHRELLNTPAFSSFGTGYNININNRTSGGSSIFAKVVVTTPTGTQIVYKPQASLSYLVVMRADDTPTAGPIFRLRGEYENPATPGNPKDKETGTHFLEVPYTEAEIVALKDQSVWTLEFFHVNPNTPNEVQRYRTLSRAQTIGEIRNAAFVQLTPATRADLISATASDQFGAYVFEAPSANDPNVVDFSAPGGLDAWSVPVGALAPTNLNAYGRGPNNGARFNDGTGVPSKARKATVYCSPQTQGDLHCDSSFGSPQYALGSSVNSFELWARNGRQVEFSKLIGTYKLN